MKYGVYIKTNVDFLITAKMNKCKCLVNKMYSSRLLSTVAKEDGNKNKVKN